MANRSACKESLNCVYYCEIRCNLINVWFSQLVYLIFRVNLKPTDFKDNQILSRPIDSYEKHRATFQLNKTGRISLFFRYPYYLPLYQYYYDNNYYYCLCPSPQQKFALRKVNYLKLLLFLYDGNLTFINFVFHLHSDTASTTCPFTN